MTEITVAMYLGGKKNTYLTQSTNSSKLSYNNGALDDKCLVINSLQKFATLNHRVETPILVCRPCDAKVYNFLFLNFLVSQ